MKQNDFSFQVMLGQRRGAGWGRAIKEEREVQGRPRSCREDPGCHRKRSSQVNAQGVFTRGWGSQRAFRACLGEKGSEVAGGLRVIYSCPGQLLLTLPNPTSTRPPRGPGVQIRFPPHAMFPKCSVHPL